MRLSDISPTPYGSLDPTVIFGFKAMVERTCDELGLGYDILEPSGWTFRRLPDGRWWAEHPAGGHAERGGSGHRDRCEWHGESTTWIGSGLRNV